MKRKSKQIPFHGLNPQINGGTEVISSAISRKFYVCPDHFYLIIFIF
ncbi:MAG: hypothetical protein E6811_03810 [Enterococcus faecalis]|nr:hypothetical protein [Enterococcus faecalis]MDU1723788.1 hypothetical protein [Enterococcus faecalis]MDV2548667.1 hypothetical protein [Enterococcus faecalis]MUN88241.1 hypothetical protein [Enterococcus faecalis]HCT2559649.1 hypothetical protein [Enterococcus faecalis]